jgi:hypothetical protein
LRSSIPSATHGAISPQAVIDAGATGLTSLTRDRTLISRLRNAYTVAISHTMILLLITICVSIPVAFGMKWLNIKDVSIEREKEKAEVESLAVFVEKQRMSSADREEKVAEK